MAATPELFTYRNKTYLVYPRGTPSREIPPYASGMPMSVYVDWQIWEVHRRTEKESDVQTGTKRTKGSPQTSIPGWMAF